MSEEEKESAKLETLIELLYTDRLSQYGKRKLVKYIENQQKEIEELKKENRFLKKHEYTSICQSCKKEFYHKRANVLWCKECAKTIHNKNYYANLSEEKKKERAEKSKLAMRKIREMRRIK